MKWGQKPPFHLYVILTYDKYFVYSSRLVRYSDRFMPNLTPSTFQCIDEGLLVQTLARRLE